MNRSLNGHRDVGQNLDRGVLKPTTSRAAKRILITTLGSFGDLHPFLPIAFKLRALGHDVVVGTCPEYRQKIEKHGFEFAPIGPGWLFEAESVKQARSFRIARIIQELLLPALPQTYEDTLAAAKGADLLVAMQANLAAPLVAEKQNIPWVSAIHLPIGFFSAYDPPALTPFPGLMRSLRFLGPTFWKPAKFLIKRMTTDWVSRWAVFRKEIGLAADRDVSPLSECRSPYLHLGLFSSLLAPKQPDWPAQTVLTGFPWYEEDDANLPDELSRFLDDGPAPIVFSLGTAISKMACERTFFEESAVAAQRLGYRAVLLVNQNCRPTEPLPNGVVAFDYAPFSKLLPRAAALVHHGGIGSTGLAMRAACPQIVVPCAWDQYDNAARAARLGIARTLPRHRYTAARAQGQLRRLLNDRRYAERATAIAGQVALEDGAQVASEALSELLQPTPSTRLNDIPQSDVSERYFPDEEESDVAGSLAVFSAQKV